MGSACIVDQLLIVSCRGRDKVNLGKRLTLVVAPENRRIKVDGLSSGSVHVRVTRPDVCMERNRLDAPAMGYKRAQQPRDNLADELRHDLVKFLTGTL